MQFQKSKAFDPGLPRKNRPKKRYVPSPATPGRDTPAARRHAGTKNHMRPCAAGGWLDENACALKLSPRYVRRLKEILARLPQSPTEQQVGRAMAKIARLDDPFWHLSRLLVSLNGIRTAPEGLEDYERGRWGLLDAVFRGLAGASAEGGPGRDWPAIFWELARGGFDHLRVCGICDALYLAGRRDQRCCSRRCAGALRQRVWRARWRTKYKPARYRAQEKRDGH